MDKERKELYVFGYGLSLIFPFLIAWHLKGLAPSFGSLVLFVSMFLMLLFFVTRIATLKPFYNIWIFAVIFWVLTEKIHHGLTLVPMILLVVSTSSLIVTILKIEAIKPIYNIWMPAVRFIGATVSTVILTVLFYFVFGVVGIILRLLRKDLLDQKMFFESESYWHKREEIEFDKERCTKQF